MAAVLHRAARECHIFRAQNLGDIADAQPVACQTVGIGLDGNLVFVAAVNIDRSYAVNAFKRRGNLILGNALQLGKIRAAQAELYNRHHIHVDCHDNRCGSILRKIGFHPVNAVAQVNHGLAHIGAVGKGDAYLRRAFGGIGRNLIHARN